MPILEGLKKDVLEEMPVFEREIAIYAKVLPEMKRIMDSIGDDEKIAPSLIYHSSNPPVIILEDISQKGFKMYGKLFDFEDVTKIVKKMAKFHALSMYINENKSEKDFNLPDYDEVYINEKSIDKMRVFFDGMSVLKDYVKNWPGYEEIAEKVAKLPPKFLQKLLKIYKANPEPGLNVLCHGDIQINNMMVLKNGQDIEEIIFLDFQLSFWASPAIDLLYVLYVTGTANVRQRKDEVLLLYHRALTDYLQRIGFHQEGPPSLQDLHIDMLKLDGNLLGLCFLPMFYIDKSQVDMNAFAEPTAQAIEKFYHAFYTNPKFTDVLKDILKSLWYRGILD
uniref:Putative ecdysteroid kinase n=1 Tax=Lutzomyia longipalpis TaxID=7200 RepID=A0A1B0C8X4_LUTLO